MNPTSIQACMDTTDWLKGIVQDQDSTMMDSSSSSPSGELMPCSTSISVPPPALERRLRPQQDQALKCPRCDSTHTKFCYYNNYSLSQPRYFCKTCRRYWTKGGSLRNVPVGGGCRKNKRPGSGGGKKQVMIDHGTPLLLHQYHSLGPSAFNEHGAGVGADLQLSSSFSGFFPPITHLGQISGNGHRDFGNFMDFTHGDHVVEEKFGVIVGNPMRTQFFPCAGGNGSVGYGDMSSAGLHGMSPVGFSINGSHTSLMTPLHFDGNQTSSGGDADVKPTGKLLSLEWQDSGCNDVSRESFGYNNGVGIWGSMENGHHGTTASTSNPLV